MATLFYRVRATGSGWQGAGGLSTFYFRGASPSVTSNAEALEAAKRVRAYFVALQGVTPGFVTWSVSNQVDVLKDDDGSLASSWVVTPQASVAGSGLSSSFSPATAVVGQLLSSTVVSGRRVRGRTYYCPLATGTGDAQGNPAAGTVTAMTNGLTALATSLGTAITNVVWHRPETPAVGLVVDVTGYGVYGRFGVLRSRRD